MKQEWGQLVEMGTKKGRKSRPKLKVGICGEHGGDPRSIDLCHRVGMDYVSCCSSYHCCELLLATEYTPAARISWTATGYIVHADTMAEVNRPGITAVLSADANLEFGLDLRPFFVPISTNCPTPVSSKALERIFGQYLLFKVNGEESADVIAGKPKVVCVRSFVPKEKNSAVLQSHPLSGQPGISIHCPDKVFEFHFFSFIIRPPYAE